MTNSLPRFWDFELALEFSRAFSSGLQVENDQNLVLISLPPPRQACKAPRSLGDFSRIYQVLGIDPPSSPEQTACEPPAITSDRPSSPSSLSEPAEDFHDFVNKTPAKGVRWNDTIDGRDSQGQLIGTHLEYENAQGGAFEVAAASPFALIPSSILFQSTPTPKPSNLISSTDPSVIRPFHLLSSADQKVQLLQKLTKRFPDPISLFVTDPQSAISNLEGVSDPKGIHIFVDFSNIIIGFYNKLKATRGLHEKAYVKQPPLSYHSLALTLERGRPVARRVLVGSTSKSIYSHTGPQKVAKHFNEAELCSYEMNILDRVSKVRPVSSTRRKKNGTGNGYATATSGDESTAFMELKRPVMAEQGVDELLQMKILESIIDTSKPTTIVLASGDAAEAEYSGGFLKTVQRALNKGWKVEIAAWREGLSREYHNKDFLRKWDGKFKIVELDDFVEEFLAVYVETVARVA